MKTELSKAVQITPAPACTTTVELLLPLLFALNLSAQPMPHHFSGITALPDKTVVLTLDGNVSNMFNLSGAISNQFRQMFDLYMVEASTNLADWTPLAQLLRTNNDPSPLIFQDTNAVGSSQRFYRTFTNHLLTGFPKPSGPFAVGTIDRVMIDPARTNNYRYSPPTNAFPVTFWYPADPPRAALLPSRMWCNRVATDTILCSLYGVDSRWTLISPKLMGHRFSDVRLAAGTNKYPVVIYSHGDQSTRETSSHIAEELASHGYVVVAADHVGCYATEFPDGRYLKGAGSGDVQHRLKDMSFLVSEMARLDGDDALFAGRLDLDHIGVSGISSSGMVVETCRTNSHVKCAVIWDATNLQMNSAGLQKPFLAALAANTVFYPENQWLFNKAITNATLLQIRGSVHQSASDAAWTFQSPAGRAPALAFDACLVWFFDTYLKGETPPFPDKTEIYNLQRK
jgi:dienelactone hydrolase